MHQTNQSMAQTQEQRIEAFTQSNHYKDICHMIDYIENQDIFNSCMEELGYKIGIDLNTKDMKRPLKSVIIGANGEFRVLSWADKIGLVTESVIVTDNTNNN